MKVRSRGLIARWVVAGASWALLCGASGAVVAPDETFEAALSTLDEKLAAVRDLTADFTEEKFTALLKKPLVSRGRVRMKSPRMRWETVAPHPSVLLMDEVEVRVLYTERKTIEVYPLKDHVRVPAMSPAPRLTQLREHFDLARLSTEAFDAAESADGFLAVRLTPRNAALAEHLDHVDVLIDRTSGCAAAVRLYDVDGDRTLITFRNVRTNTGLQDHHLDLDPPAGCRIVYPLGHDGEPDSASGRDGS